MESLPISGFNPDFLHKPKEISEKNLKEVDEMIQKKVDLKIVTMDQKTIEGNLIGLDSFGHIIIEYIDKYVPTNQPKMPPGLQKQISNQQKQPYNQQKPPTSQQKPLTSQQKQIINQQRQPNNQAVQQNNQQNTSPNQQTQEKSYYVIKLSNIYEISEINVQKNKD